jgi:RNA polymerase sigma-70 factor (ECF subfamily)
MEPRAPGRPDDVIAQLTERPPIAATTSDWLDQLWRDSSADVYAYVASLLRDRAAAEDVTALAFERAFRKRRTFSERRGSLRGWLFAIARNAALDELRRRRRSATLVADIPDEAADGTGNAERWARRLAVREAMATLDARDRELVLLKFHGQLSNGELASILSTSESNVGTRLHRAMTKLREACDETT